MTDVVETFRKVAYVGDLKIVVIKTDANAATGHTIDFGTDTAHGAGSVFKEILFSKLQNTTGTDVASATWNNSTGILTLPSISTGVHKITVIGY